MRILGIDPGLKATGYGLIDTKGDQIQILEVGVIETKDTDYLQNRIEKTYRNLDKVLCEYKPDIMVLEKLYTHYKHSTIACRLGHVRGVICLLCAQRKVKLIEYSVKRIRKALVGNGNASKQQTQGVVAHILNINKNKLTLDASDALALALGHINMKRLKR